MKKLCAFISILSIVVLFTSCGDSLNTLPNASDQGSASPEHTDGDKLQIVATIFPIYDWTREIAGEKADVNMLFSKGVDLHSFQPSAEYLSNISCKTVTNRFPEINPQAKKSVQYFTFPITKVSFSKT